MPRPRIIMTEAEVRALPTLAEARAIGSRFFFEGPCSLGHISRFVVASRQCAECVRIRSLEYYAKNAEKKRERQRAYHHATYVPRPRTPADPTPYWIRAREACRRNARRCYANNRLVYIAKAARRRALKRAAPGEGITSAQAASILKAQGGRCAICRSRSHLELDHIMPLARGGENSPRNAQWLCKPCNSAKSARHPIDFAQSRGLLL